MKTNTIKLSKSLLVAAIAVGAFSARADWVIKGPNDITVTPGESGSSVYQFTAPSGPPSSAQIVDQTSSYQVEGGVVDLPIGPTAPITSYVAGVTPVGETITGGETFDITVDWTVSSNPSYIGQEFAANYLIDTDAYGQAGAAQNMLFSTSVTPEPAQTVAGALLLGCGLVVAVGKRFLKKKTVIA